MPEMKEEKKKATAAHMKATKKFEDKAYFKTLVRFPAAEQERIRAAAGSSLNGFIVKTVLEKVESIEKGEAQKGAISAKKDDSREE